jgi:thiamine pyrophosphokinase
VSVAIVFAAVRLAPTPRLRSRLAQLDNPYVVAADDGATTALAFGLTPHLVVGDLDSLDQATLERLRAANVPIEVHPRDKDATDGQLAIDSAMRQQPTHLYLLGFLGGPRLDQALANVLLLTRMAPGAVLLDERNEALLVRPHVECTWSPEPSEIVSLIPLGDDVEGVRTHGLRWALDDERLVLGDTRGVSNEPSDLRASVSVRSGLLLVTRNFPD